VAEHAIERYSRVIRAPTGAHEAISERQSAQQQRERQNERAGHSPYYGAYFVEMSATRARRTTNMLRSRAIIALRCRPRGGALRSRSTHGQVLRNLLDGPILISVPVGDAVPCEAQPNPWGVLGRILSTRRRPRGEQTEGLPLCLGRHTSLLLCGWGYREPASSPTLRSASYVLSSSLVDAPVWSSGSVRGASSSSWRRNVSLISSNSPRSDRS
jgi:hypothetical protein